MKFKTLNEAELLEHALQGLMIQRRKVTERIDDIRKRLPNSKAPVAFERPHRHLSAAGRRAIKEAQIRRWKKYRRNHR